MEKSVRSEKRALLLAACLTTALLLLTLGEPASAQTKARESGRNASSPAASLNTPSVEERKLELDRERLDFDKQKFATETAMAREKIEHDRSQAVWPALSTILPFTAGFFTLGYSLWSFRKQSTETARLQNQSARLQFEIKAAEIAFTGKTPLAVQNRAAVLKRMFGDRLPQGFPAPFDPAAYGAKAESSAEKLQFVELLLKYPDHQQQAVDLWAALFTDEWLDRVRPVVSQHTVTAPGNPANKIT